MLKPNQLVALNLAVQRGAVPPDELIGALLMVEPEQLDEQRTPRLKVHPAIRRRQE